MKIVKEDKFFKWENVPDNLHIIIMPTGYGKCFNKRKRYFTLEQRNKMIKEQNKRIKIELAKENVYLKDLLMQQKEVLDKIKEYIENELYSIGGCVNGSDLPYEAIEPLKELLEEIE